MRITYYLPAILIFIIWSVLYFAIPGLSNIHQFVGLIGSILTIVAFIIGDIKYHKDGGK